MRLGKGLHRDRPDHPWRKKQRDARHLLGGKRVAMLVPGTVVSLRRWEIPTFDQLGSQGCVGHSWAMAVAMALAAAGQPLDFIPSPGDIYKLARCIGRGAPDVRLADDGSMLADAAAAISLWGIRPIGELNPRGNTDVTPENVNVEPALLDLETDANTLVAGEYRLDLNSTMAIKDACSLLDAGIPLARGSFVDSAYENYRYGDIVGVPNEADPNGGGHATVITGYYVNPDGSVDFDDKTSWGDAFGGDHGHVRISQGCFLSSWDVYPMSIRKVMP